MTCPLEIQVYRDMLPERIQSLEAAFAEGQVNCALTRGLHKRKARVRQRQMSRIRWIWQDVWEKRDGYRGKVGCNTWYQSFELGRDREV